MTNKNTTNGCRKCVIRNKPRIQITLSDEEHYALIEAAHAAGLSRSQLVGRLVMSAAVHASVPDDGGTRRGDGK